MMPFFCIHISQGSVATCLKRGGIFKHAFVANLRPSRPVKIFLKNRMIVSEVMAKSLVYCFFDSRCIIFGPPANIRYGLTVLIHNLGHFGPPLPLLAPGPPALPGLPMASYATADL